jgi:hypothetical protein
MGVVHAQAIWEFNWSNPDQFLRVATASRLTRIPARTLRHLAATGQVTARRFGRRAWTICARDLDRICRNRAMKIC